MSSFLTWLAVVMVAVLVVVWAAALALEWKLRRLTRKLDEEHDELRSLLAKLDRYGLGNTATAREIRRLIHEERDR